MADYYPVLVRAVSRLTNDSAQARQELYEKARIVVEAELRRQQPRKSAREIIREQAALETAIRRLEAEASGSYLVKIDDGDALPANPTGELDGVLKSIGAMLLGIAAVAAMAAFVAVFYICGLVWVYGGVIGYPMLLILTTVMIGLFAALSWAFRRRTRGEDAIGLLLLLAHTAAKKLRGIALSRPDDEPGKPQIST